MLRSIRTRWIGRGTRAIDGLTLLGYQDFRTDAARRLVAGLDFLLTVGSGDANPTTILETMAVPQIATAADERSRATVVEWHVHDAMGVRVQTGTSPHAIVSPAEMRLPAPRPLRAGLRVERAAALLRNRPDRRGVDRFHAEWTRRG